MINASFVILSHFPDLEQNLRQKLYPVAKGKGQNLLEQNYSVPGLKDCYNASVKYSAVQSQ